MEKNKANYIVYVLLFCVVIAGVGGFFLGTHFGDKDEVVVKDKGNEKDVAGEVIVSKDELDKLGRELFAKTSATFRYGDDLYFYNEDKLDYNNMDNNKKLMVALENIPILYLYQNGFDSEMDALDLTITSTVDKDIFETSYKSLFGTSKNIKYESFSVDDMGLGTCDLEDNNVLCKTDSGFGSGRGSAVNFFLNYEKTEQFGNSVIVYSSLLGYNDWSAGDEGAIYNDYGLNNVIGDKYIEDNIKETLFKEYGDKASKYKLTFNQDTNGNWYWVSTELIKK